MARVSVKGSLLPWMVGAIALGVVLGMAGRGTGKTQAIRLVDVFALGPFLVWAGIQGGGLTRVARFALIVSGVATVVFNGLNWLDVRARGM